jgi:drug/metabolite transporter (DMT)-like permease
MTHHWGYIGATASAIVFGMAATLNKIALAEVHPMIVAGLIYLIAGVFLFLIRYSPLHERILSLLETPTKTEPAIVSKDYMVLGLVTFSGAVVAPFLFIYGLNETSAINASLLLNMESLFTVFIAIVFFKERGAIKDYLGVLLLIVGAVFITTRGEFQGLTLAQEIIGNLLIVSACLFWGIDNNLSKLLSKKRDLPHIVALKCLVGGVILLFLALLLGVDFKIPLFSLPYLFSVGAFSIGFSIVLFVFALREIGSMKTGVIYSTSSFFGASFAFLVLREPFTATQLIAGLTMLLGVYVLYKK